MSKINITKEQEEALEAYKNINTHNDAVDFFIRERNSWRNDFKCLKEFTVDQFARLVYEKDSYKVMVSYKVGDILVRTKSGSCKEGYTFIAEEVTPISVLCHKYVHDNFNVRLATEEEAKLFKRWSKVKKGDILIHGAGKPVFFVDYNSTDRTVIYREHLDGNVIVDNQCTFTVYSDYTM